MNGQPRFLLRWLSIAAVAVTVCGCHDRAVDFKPPEDVARTALIQAMQAWQAGQSAGEIAGSKPAIHVTDNHANRVKKLDQFKILGEKPGRAGRTYAVELTLRDSKEKIKTEYIVVGIDPLWVFRREDYELLMHWDHRMPPVTKETSVP